MNCYLLPSGHGCEGVPWKRRALKTTRKQAEQELQASKDRLQLALDAARLRSFRYDPRRDTFWGDARAKEIFDFDAAQEKAGVDELLKRIHPDDVRGSGRSAMPRSIQPILSPT
jgi:PAS domain-containing protein